MKETEIGAVAAAWLASRDLEVFQEVVVDGRRIDLVGRRHGLVVAVECKVSPSLWAIYQALRWREIADESWVAAPAPKGWDADQAVGHICHQLGVGWFATNQNRVRSDPTCLLDRRTAKLHDALHPEQKTGARAGTNGGGYSTEFKRTVGRLIDFVGENPDGVFLRDAIKAIDHHYASVGSAVSNLHGLMQGHPKLFAGIRLEREGGRPRLFPVPKDQF